MAWRTKWSSYRHSHRKRSRMKATCQATLSIFLAERRLAVGDKAYASDKLDVSLSSKALN